MSDQPPPPKPMPGSLRDRIAAFEKSTPSNTPPSAPRPKPAGVSWKPKPATPPDSPGLAEGSSSSQPKRFGGGMSASDAKESIGKGGSLKERMAALQGKGAFGAPPPPVAPKPIVEKPKWKPPPPVASPPDESEEKEAITEKPDTPAAAPMKSPEEQLEKSSGENEDLPTGFRPEAEEGDGEYSEKDPDPEEEERQRRAALAARMARLGGARVGMGPPVFGGPAYKKPQPKPQEDVSEPVKSEDSSVKSSPVLENDLESVKPDEVKPEYSGPQRKFSDTSMLSPESTPSASTSPRIPSSMPVPAGPRRAAPPRRKVKSPSLTPAEEQEPVPDVLAPELPSTEDREPEIGQVSISADPAPQSTDESLVLNNLSPLVNDVRPESAVFEEPAVVMPMEETHIPRSTTYNQGTGSIEGFIATSPAVVEEPEAIQEEEAEEDEAARRKRVAERLAKSGGVNPFTMPPPQRKPTSSADSQQEVSSTSVSQSPSSERRTSIRKASSDSVSRSLPPPPARRSSQTSFTSSNVPAKRPSMDSVASRDFSSHDDDFTPPSIAAGISEEPERSVSIEEADIAEERFFDSLPDQPDSYADESPNSHEITSADARSRLSSDSWSYADAPAHVVSSSVILGESEEEEEEEYPPPPPPARTIPRPVEDEENEEESSLTFSASVASPELPRRLPPRPILDDDSEMSDAPLPHPHRRSVPAPPQLADDPEEAAPDSDEDEARPIPPSTPLRFVPPPEEVSRTMEDEPSQVVSNDEYSDEEEILPTPPRRDPSPPEHWPQEEPLFVPPPPPPKAVMTHPHPAQSRSSVQEIELGVDVGPPTQTPTVTAQSRGAEILDEEEGDPIDPSFYSPNRGTSASLPQTSPATPAASADLELDPVEQAEQSRRRTIAERMAKLGGIKFGAAPVPRAVPPPGRQESEEGQAREQGGEGQEGEEDQPKLTEEEEDQARKERISAKMASMGGMRIGMQPYGMFAGGTPPVPHSRPPLVSSESTTSSSRALPPRHAAPPPPQTQEIDSERESDEGVHVEAEESEMEEVSYEDVQDEQEEADVLPPVPIREGRSVPPGRPPIPTSVPARRPSIQTPISPQFGDTTSVSTSRKSSASYAIPPATSDYVMVEGSDDEALPPPPPPRASRPPPPRAAPAPPPPPSSSDLPPSDSISSQWEMPSIPSVDFGGNTDLSLSWTEDMDQLPSAPAPPAEPTLAPRKSSIDQVMSSENLVAVWGRVGVQVCEVATALYESSKKALIGDGTYCGFVEAALKEVPNAAPISGREYGYLVYMQSGASVQKRLSEIMPGDVVWMHEAKLKGHKGIQTYSQSVGIGEPLVGIVGEFEPKKFKIRVFQANQHVGQQTVESVSYRLDDLKSGSVKIFRVLEA
ncbi:hypothetical protein D9757_006238 [Collybiopsis confluens]|uniref:BBC1/AIM3 cysteine proteinase-fold domain-containing protein n=1 Tax=Collybiopsis confluens TaxID=2823264 RepID=A0A8H5HK21_9AGAR|nr:hypothetical protein D9757_006238 [Collybiopsis confluens]